VSSVQHSRILTARAAVILVCASMVPFAAASETARLCDQTVEYTLVPVAAEVSPAARAFHGIWLGSTIYPAVNISEVELCIAFVVESITPNGAVRTKHIRGDRVRFLSGPGYAIKPAVVPWNGKLTGDLLDLLGTHRDGTKWSYHLRVAGNEMRGTYVTPNGNGTAVLTRR
jgi:hypothetical protein